MVIWLASYPRSGNTLLRTILYFSFGLESYTDEQDNLTPEKREAVSEKSVSIYYDGIWKDFYASAVDSSSTYFVKTHRPPRDEQKTIYVIRDGRNVVDSYLAYNAKFNSDCCVSQTLLDLILGNDFYGDWSSHYSVWESRGRDNLLVLKYEELVEPSSETLQRIARFINFVGEVRPFTNPFADLHKIEPDFFRKAQRSWTRTDAWSEDVRAVFYELHGELMLRFSYASEGEIKEARSCMTQMQRALVWEAYRARLECNALIREMALKEDVIKELREAADLRLDIIRDLQRRL